MSQRRIPKHCFHKGAGQGYVTLNGDRYYTGKWKTEASEARYRELLAAYLKEEPLAAAAPRARHASPSEPSLEFICAEYLDHSKAENDRPGQRDNKQHNHNCNMVKRLLKHFAGTPAACFGPKALKTFMRHQESELCRSFVNDQKRRVVRMFRWAASEELIPPQVHQALLSVEGLRRGRTAARETEKVRPVPWSDVEATLPQMHSTLRSMVMLHWYTGLRPSELVDMRWEEIDRSSETWVYSPNTHKNAWRGDSAARPIGPKGREVLTNHRSGLASGPMFNPSDGYRERGRKPPKHFGPDSTYTPDSYRKAIQRACVRAGVKPWFPYRIRHSFCTRVDSIAGLEAANIAMGD